MSTVQLVGAEEVSRAAARMQDAAQRMNDAASRMEQAFDLRRRWEEEYLARIEAIVREELDFYRAPPEQETLQEIARAAARQPQTPDFDGIADAVALAVLEEVGRWSRFRYGAFSILASELTDAIALLALPAVTQGGQMIEDKEDKADQRGDQRGGVASKSGSNPALLPGERGSSHGQSRVDAVGRTPGWRENAFAGTPPDMAGTEPRPVCTCRHDSGASSSCPIHGGPFVVEVDKSGCERCGHGAQWTVVGPGDVAIGQSFEDQELAEEIAEYMNQGFRAGCGGE